MGKQKRARQKYHIACVNGRLDNEDAKSETSKSAVSIKSVPGKSKVAPDDNLFKDIQIDVDNLKKLSSEEDDRKSMKSISKSIKRSIAESGTNVRLTKKEKRELRKNLFIKKSKGKSEKVIDKSAIPSTSKEMPTTPQFDEEDLPLPSTSKQSLTPKIDAVHQLIKKNQKSKKGSKNEVLVPNLDELPQENMLFFESNFKPPKGPRPVSLQKKPIAKAKKRKQELLNNVEALKKLIADKTNIDDAMGTVTESVQNKVFNGII